MALYEERLGLDLGGGKTLQDYIRETAAKYGLPTDVFEKQLWRESQFDPKAVSPAGAQGIAQFMPGTAREVGLADPFDPSSSVDKAGQYLSSLRDRMGGDMSWALAAYNAGPGNASKWRGQGLTPDKIPFEETRNYVQSLLSKQMSSSKGEPSWLSNPEQPDKDSGEPEWLSNPAPEEPPPEPEGLGSKILGGVKEGLHYASLPLTLADEGIGKLAGMGLSPSSAPFSEQFAAAFVPPPNSEVSFLDKLTPPGMIVGGLKGMGQEGAANISSAAMTPVAQLLPQVGMAGQIFGALGSMGPLGAKLETLLGAAFAGDMGYEGLKAAKDTFASLQENGVTPDTVQMGVQALSNLALGGMGLRAVGEGLRPRRAEEVTPPPVRATEEVIPPPPMMEPPPRLVETPTPTLEELPPPPRLEPLIAKRGRSGRMEKPDFVPEKLPEVWGEETAPSLIEEAPPPRVAEAPDFGVSLGVQERRWAKDPAAPEKIKERLEPFDRMNTSLLQPIKDAYRKFFVERLGKEEITLPNGEKFNQSNPEHQAAIDSSTIARYVYDAEAPVAASRNFGWLKKTTSPTESFPAQIEINLAKLPKFLEEVHTHIKALDEVGVKGAEHFEDLFAVKNPTGTYRNDLISSWEWWKDDFIKGADGRYRLKPDRADPEYIKVKGYQALLAHEVGHSSWGDTSTFLHGPSRDLKFDPLSPPREVLEALGKDKGRPAGDYEEFIKVAAPDLSSAPLMARLHDPSIYKPMAEELQRAEMAFANKTAVEVEKTLGVLPKGFVEGGVLPPPPVNPQKRSKTEVALEILNMPRATATSGDLSMILRQAVIGTSRHPLRAVKMLPETLRVLKSTKDYELALQHMVNDPEFNFMTKKAGLSFSDIMKNPEEVYYGSRMIRETFKKFGKEHLDPIAASERAFTYYLNKMRYDMMKDAMRDMDGLGIPLRRQVMKKGRMVTEATPAAKEMAEWVNVATGHGNIPKTGVVGAVLRGSHNLLNTIFFSPRLVWSRGEALNMALNPLKWHSTMMKIAQDAPSKSAAAYLMMKHQGLDLAATAGVIGLMTSTAAVALGGEVEKDPRSADFLQVRKGTTRLDLTGGFRPYFNLGARLITGMTKPQFTNAKTQSRLDTISQFGRSRFSPVLTTMHDMLAGVNFQGEDYWGPWRDVYNGDAEITPDMAKQLFEISLERVGDASMPMLIRDIYQAMDEDPATAALVAVPALLGASLNTHDKAEGIDKELYEALREAQISPFSKKSSVKLPHLRDKEGRPVKASLPWEKQEEIKRVLDKPFYERISELSRQENFKKLSPLAKHLILKSLFVSFASAKTKMGVGFVPPPRLKEAVEKAAEVDENLSEERWMNREEWLPL